MKSRKILIIDDEPEWSEMLKMRLEARGFAVESALDGTKGLEAARSNPPDLILLDVMLPGADGGDIAREITSEPSLKTIPIIFLTAAITEAEAEKRWSEHSERMLSKTMDAEAILKKIQEIL